MHPPVIYNSYIFKILLPFTWRKDKRSFTWSPNKPLQNITLSHQWGCASRLELRYALSGALRRKLIKIIVKKSETYKIVDFAVPAEYRLKLKQSEKKDKYLDLNSELKKKLWNIKKTFLTITIRALGKVTGRLLKRPEDLEVRERVETIQTTTLLRSKPRNLRRLALIQTSVKDHQLKLP